MSRLTAQTLLSDDLVEVTISDARPDTRDLLAALDEQARSDVAIDAWRVGLRALGSALVEAREARLEDIGARLRADLQEHVLRVGDEQRRRMSELLTHFFDPKDGAMSERLDAFVRDGGELERLLRQHLAGDNSTLAAMLAARVGENSPLFRLLDPNHARGAVQAIQRGVKQALDESRHSLAEALNPRIAGSPVAQFLTQLRHELTETEKRRGNQLEVLTRELDANRQGSLLSQLVRRTTEAQQMLLHAVNPEVEGSPMQVVQASIEHQLRDASERQLEAIEHLRQSQATFHVEVREAIARLEGRREGRGAVASGGNDFEKELLDALFEQAADLPVLRECVGTSVGARPNCKLGDGLLTFTPDGPLPGSRVVVEVKRDRSYTPTKALEELQKARENRLAQVGLFVMASTHAPSGFPAFARYGEDVLLVWDPQAPGASAMLRAALLLSLALLARSPDGTSNDVHRTLARVAGVLQRELDRLAKMQKHVEAILTKAEELQSELGRAHRSLGRLGAQAAELLESLAGNGADPSRERDCPLVVGRGVEAR